MNSRREQFNTNTLSARREGDEAQSVLVAEVVNDMVGDLANFDPARLKGLSPQSFKSLANALGRDEQEGGTAPPPVSHERLPTSVKGWAEQRRAEPWHWGFEVALATFTSLAIAIVAFAAAALLL